MYSSYEENPEKKPYYITTAIDYPNAPPHVGHSLEKVAADVIARYHRLQGFDTYFTVWGLTRTASTSCRPLKQTT